MNRFYRIYTFAVLAVFAALPFAESLNADPIWTKRDTPSFTDTDTMSYVNGSFTKCEVFNVDQGLLTLNTHYRYGTNEDPTKATDKSVDTKLCISGSMTVVTPIMNNGSHIELTYKPSGWQYHKPLIAYSIATANDVPSRTPDDWTIYGSNDGGATWDTLVTVTDAAIPDAYKTMYDFPISTSKAYSLYKMDITGDRGENNIVQMSEISFWTSPGVITDTTPNFDDNDFGTYVPLKVAGTFGTKDGATAPTSNYYFGANETPDKLVDRNIPDSSGKVKLYVGGNLDNSDFFKSVDSFSIDFATTKAPFQSASNKDAPLALPDHVIQNTTTNAYAITTANDAQNLPNRNPDSWTLYGSNDKTSWIVLDEISGANLPAANYQMCTIPLPEGTKAYDNYRLTISGTKGTDRGMQLSEFSVWSDQAVQFKIPTSAIQNATFSNDGSWHYGTAGENEANLYDGTGNKLCVSGFDQNDLVNKPLVITFEMTDPIAVGSYSLTTANDAPGRDPSSWTLFASNDGTTWTQLDDLSDIRLTDNRFYTQNFAVNNEDEYSFYKFEISKLKEVTNVFQLGEITFYGTNLPMDAIPEPSTLCLLGLGLLGMIIWRKRTNK